MSTPHIVVAQPDNTTYPVLTGDEKRCPRCLSKWEGDPIPENIRHHYGNATHWSLLVGVELPGVYDGVAVWKCPSCRWQFPRFKWARKYCVRPVWT